MATVTKPMALDESIHTTDGNDTNIADLMQSGLAAIASAVGAIPNPTAANVSWSGTINGTAVTNVSGALTALNDGLKSNTTLLGSTDISSIDDGTVTGAIDAINTDLANFKIETTTITLDKTSETNTFNTGITFANYAIIGLCGPFSWDNITIQPSSDGVVSYTMTSDGTLTITKASATWGGTNTLKLIVLHD